MKASTCSPVPDPAALCGARQYSCAHLEATRVPARPGSSSAQRRRRRSSNLNPESVQLGRSSLRARGAHLLGTVVALTMGDLGEVPAVGCAPAPARRPRPAVSGNPLKRRHLPSLLRGCVYSAVLPKAAPTAATQGSALGSADILLPPQGGRLRTLNDSYHGESRRVAGRIARDR